MINSLTCGGAERVVSDLVVSLKKSFSVSVIVIENNFFFKLPKDVPVYSLTKSKISKPFFVKLLELPFLARTLKRIIQENNFEIVQSHLYRSNFVNVLAKLFGAGHQVQIVQHNTITDFNQNSFFGSIRLKLSQWLYPKADLIVGVSKSVLQEVKKVLKKMPRSIVVYNPIPCEKIQKLKRVQVDPKVFKFNSKNKYMLYTGRLIELKNIPVLLRAFEQVLPTIQNLELILLGEGPERKKLQNFSKKLDVESRVHFLGQVENPYQFMFHSDLFILVSSHEAFGNVLVEAMACGCPVISTNVQGPREILYDSKTKTHFGSLVAINDIKKLAKLITKLLNSSKLQRHFRSKGLRRSKSFDIELISKQYKKILN